MFAFQLLILELSDDGFQKVLFNDDTSEVLQDCPNDLFAIELSRITELLPEREQIFLVLMNMKPTENRKLMKRLSAPRVICVPREYTYQG